MLYNKHGFMRTVFFISFVFFIISGSISFGFAADKITNNNSDNSNNSNISIIKLPIPNSGFETTGADGFPVQWHLDDTLKTDGNVFGIMVDSQTVHSGNKSLSVELNHWGQCTLLSAPLSFKVGQLYRLSGWVKTESAVTWPTNRYPTSVPACLTMASFPFTNHSPSVGATSDWKKIETLFIATRGIDQVRLHLGFNGNAKGRAWFDDIQVEKVEDITSFIPMDTVRWFGPAFRYDDKGWIFVHIEGKPYQRGYQYGYLLAEEIVAYMNKLAYQTNRDDTWNGWRQLRRVTDAVLLRKYDEEYLEEMKGIADGAAKNGATFQDRPVDFLDIVTINSSIDIGQMWRSLSRTPHPLSGRSFLKNEEELNIDYRTHKCSGFLANGPASKDGKIVFGQIFMWSGYTGVHWNVICDIVPEKGHRLVYETFPGGIHSGADFYLNETGLMMGETTVNQTPLDIDGTPQSNRIRKAAQYASSIDEAVKILAHKNNGMYTNDWLMGDTKTNEIAIFLLGTKKNKLWRSSTGEFPGGTKGFYWSNNNNKDKEVRKEYIAGSSNAPYDVVFSPWSRDLAFNRFFKEHNGKIDAIAGVNLWATAPINMPHACDGKVTTSEMAENMVFLAHFGKVTMREKFPIKGGKIPDAPDATPHLSLGYSVVSPVFVAEKLKALKQKHLEKSESGKENTAGLKSDFTDVEKYLSYDPGLLWFNTVYPDSDKENWFVSGTASYWRFLKWMPTDTAGAADYVKNELTDYSLSMLYTMDREGSVAPVKTRRIYDNYKYYRIPRVRGLFLLHQLRLLIGNNTFSKYMNSIHRRFKEKNVTNRQLISTAERMAGRSLKSFFKQWLERDDLPRIFPSAQLKKSADGWNVTLNLKQDGVPYHFITSVAIETEKQVIWKTVEVTGADETFTFTVSERPGKLVFNAGNDIPIARSNFYTFSNYFDDFHNIIFVYGTSRQIEANHTIALRYREMLADRTAEVLKPVKKDSEVTALELESNDLILLGGIADNNLTRMMADKLGLSLGKNVFQWNDKTYGNPNHGLVLVYPNPFNPKRTVYLIISNSALQLYVMTKSYRQIPSWAVFKDSRIIEKGYHPVKSFSIELEQSGK
jgi:hypothetical protein